MRRQTRIIGTHEFWFVGEPIIQRTANGELAEYIHSSTPEQRINRFAAGPFCKFGLPAAPSASGVYAVFINDKLMYIGRCENLAKRFGSNGYGLISPRNIYNDGQSTNCKLNSHILVAAKQNQTTTIWFLHTNDFVAVEASLILSLRPEWNGHKPNSVSAAEKQIHKKTKKNVINTAKSISKISQDFDTELSKLFQSATSQGFNFLDVNAGKLHRQVGEYPGKGHRMPTCCSRMRAKMEDNDLILETPPKGNGASLTIRYVLPRTNI